MESRNVRVRVLHREVYGSLRGDGDYEDDRVVDIIAWLQGLLEESIPAEYRDSAHIKIYSVGGWEDEHHAEVDVYYLRHETDEELAARFKQERAKEDLDERRERQDLERLQKKYGKR